MAALIRVTLPLCIVSVTCATPRTSDEHRFVGVRPVRRAADQIEADRADKFGGVRKHKEAVMNEANGTRLRANRSRWSSTKLAQKKGFEEENNHGSFADCNKDLKDFFRSSFSTASSLKVLDVGGGTGGMKKVLKSIAGKPDVLDYKCIDVTESKACAKFSGDHINETAKSYDVVMFNYVLHHAAESTIDLLRDAKKIANKYVVIQEDLKGTNKQDTQVESLHEWSGTYRGPKEWTQLFGLLDLSVVHDRDVPRDCEKRNKKKQGGYYVDRKLYVLKV